MSASGVLVAGRAEATVCKLDQPLSFWGGFDPSTGKIIDPHHPDQDLSLANQILMMPTGKGSSSGSSVLAEAIRLGTAPVGIIMTETDMIVAVGVIAARQIYPNCLIPVVTIDPADWDKIPNQSVVSIEDGRLTWSEKRETNTVSAKSDLP